LPGSSGSVRFGQVWPESSASLTVEGSLDRGELRDLRKALKLLAKAAAHQASDLARRLSRPDMDNIATVQASYSESVTVVGGVLSIAPEPGQPAAPD
jgi:hypothetical protein